MASTQRRPTPRRAAGRTRPAPSGRTKPKTPKTRAAATRTAAGYAVPRPKGADRPAIDRRTLIKGGVGIGAVAVLGSALSSIQGCSSKGQGDAQAPDPVVVDEGSADRKSVV